METAVEISTSLIKETKNYLKDAGFTADMYHIEDFDKKRGYVEVFFIHDGSLEYVMKDILKTPYAEYLIIKEYKKPKDPTTAIFAYKFEGD